MNWSLYKEGEFLKPLTFSNGKNQEDVVNEVLEAVKRGKNIIFIHGVCGTGKSGIALNIARSLGKTSIIVPGKNLQEKMMNLKKLSGRICRRIIIIFLAKLKLKKRIGTKSRNI